MCLNKLKACNDNRCLYYSKTLPNPASSEVVTNETREGAGLWEKCNLCNLVINRSGVTLQESVNFYNSTYIEKNSFSKGELLSSREHFEARVGSTKPIAEFLMPYLDSSMRVFELGSGTGELLYLIRDEVSYCCANEINKLYAEFIRKELKIDSSSENYLNLLFEDKFDFIISINTIDHIYDCLKSIEKIYHDLRESGFFYIEVPNDSQALKEYLPKPTRKMFRNFMYQKAHYYSFSFESLRRLLVQTGFEIIVETCRHDYSLMNYLHWYFMGKPQERLKSAMEETDIHDGNTEFEKEMNQLFSQANESFKEIMKKTMAGESICFLCRKPLST